MLSHIAVEPSVVGGTVSCGSGFGLRVGAGAGTMPGGGLGVGAEAGTMPGGGSPSRKTPSPSVAA